MNNRNISLTIWNRNSFVLYAVQLAVTGIVQAEQAPNVLNLASNVVTTGGGIKIVHHDYPLMSFLFERTEKHSNVNINMPSGGKITGMTSVTTACVVDSISQVKLPDSWTDALRLNECARCYGEIAVFPFDMQIR